jgi:dolichol-phosphate mannosyltransferase
VDVVVPLLNEAGIIREFHCELMKALDGVSDRYECRVLYVVEPSTDGTAEIVRGIAESDPRVAALFNLRRAGHQMALIAGMQHSRSDACVTLDGDLQHPPSLIPEMLRLFETGVDVVQTVRTRTEGISIFNRTSSRLYYSIINKLTDVPITPGGADFRLVSARVVEIVSRRVTESDRFLRGLVPWLGLPTAYLDFEAAPRRAGESKYSAKRRISLAVSGILSFSKIPLQAGLFLGLIVTGLAMLFALGAVGYRFAGGSVAAGWTSLVVLISLMTGAQLLALGLIGMYIGVVFDEAKKRPQVLIADQAGWLVVQSSAQEAAPDACTCAGSDGSSPALTQGTGWQTAHARMSGPQGNSSGALK